MNYFSKKYDNLTPYTPGEQPQDKKYIKLNTNESPFPPSPFSQRLVREYVGDIYLYSDPTVNKLVKVASEKFGVNEDEILFTNGSDEALYYAMLAFCDDSIGAAFPDVTYGFYKVLGDLTNTDCKEIPVKDDLSIDPDDYKNLNRTIFIANPNAQTGLYLTNDEIEDIVKNNKENVVIVDEAYIDFGNESAIPLTKKYENLLVTQTFSKSRSLAGGRLGFAIGNKSLINNLNTLKYSMNPYNVNTMTMYAGIGALIDEDYFKKNCETIVKSRKYLKENLENLGFEVTNSCSNFVLARTAKKSGSDLYKELKEKGILVRYLGDERIKDYVRITVGSKEQLDALLKAIGEIL